MKKTLSLVGKMRLGQHLRTSLNSIRFVRFIALAGVCLAMPVPVRAQTQLLSGTTPAAFSLIKGTYANGSIVSVTGQPFTQAWQVNVTTKAPISENVVLTASTSAAVSAGDAIVVTFYYRRTDTMSDEANITARFQQIGGAAASSVVIPLRGRQQWRKISIPFIANTSYPAGSARFCFQLSAQIQSLQVSGVSLVNYGQKSLFGPGIVDATPLFTFVGVAAGDRATGVVIYGRGEAGGAHRRAEIQKLEPAEFHALQLRR